MATIHELLPKVMAEIGTIPKSHEGFGGEGGAKYKFRGVDDALRHCNPILAANGISISCAVRTHEVTVREGKNKRGEPRAEYHAKLTMAVTFWSTDGTHVENVLAGEALDFGGDKASNKAMSAAFKYGLFFGLCIPVDARAVDDSDRPIQRLKQRERPNGEHPESASAREAKAISAIRNAPDNRTLDRYAEAAAKYAEIGEYSAEGYQQIEKAAIERRKELSRNGEAVHY